MNDWKEGWVLVGYLMLGGLDHWMEEVWYRGMCCYRFDISIWTETKALEFSRKTTWLVGSFFFHIGTN
jgi:hypothetical protein